MRIVPLIAAAALAAGSIAVLSPSPAAAADAKMPYANVNHANDDGNNTGDSKVDALNAAQLNQNYWQAAKTPGGVPNPPTTTIVPPGGAPMMK